MSGSLNRVMLIGNLTRDPELRTMQSGGRVCNLNVATSERWTDKQTGEKKGKAEFHRVVIFDDKLCDVAEKYLNSGSKVYLEGNLQTRKWSDQSGVEKYSTEVVLQRFRGVLIMLDSKSEPQGSSSAPPAGDLDDDIPFAPHRGL